MRQVTEATRNKLIAAAVEELREHGVRDFSIRRVAEACGLSPGAPYKHFDGKDHLILEVLKYMNGKWHEIHRSISCDDSLSLREKLTEVSVAYIVFLCKNTEFQTILMMNDNSMSREHITEKAKMSEMTRELIHSYCVSVNMSPEDEKRKTYAVRSFIYGAALMISSGNLPFDESSLDMARKCISREFDIR
ncbi:MAG: TetR/AcrR family transcriptional regulator [Ruminococcaceae bacterium]|nr:TetR/AcrR family transcriptional regulator [Oscillospiraceae bacterium]